VEGVEAEPGTFSKKNHFQKFIGVPPHLHTHISLSGKGWKQMQALRESLYRQHKNCKIHIQIAFQSQNIEKMEISSESRANSMRDVPHGTATPSCIPE
jgi:hypothetical protein